MTHKKYGRSIRLKISKITTLRKQKTIKGNDYALIYIPVNMYELFDNYENVKLTINTEDTNKILVEGVRNEDTEL